MVGHAIRVIKLYGPDGEKVLENKLRHYYDDGGLGPDQQIENSQTPLRIY